jgi:hypothetical protein
VNTDSVETLVLFTISVTANVALGVAWVRAVLRLRRLERESARPLPDERIDQLGQTVEILAAQVDQLVSGQEFLNRVLTDRLDKLGRPLAPASPRVEITPH